VKRSTDRRPGFPALLARNPTRRTRTAVAGPAVWYAPGPLHRGRSERGAVRWTVAVAIVLGIALVGAVAWFVLFRENGLIGPDVPEFSFELGRVKGQGVEGAASSEALQGPAEDLRSTLDAMYVAGFVDPGKWDDGRFPEVLEAFAGPAAKQARRDLQDLTLGSTSRRVERVEPKPGRLNVSFLLEGRRPLAAVAFATFRAVGELTNRGRLSIEHRGEYMMRVVDGAWRIVGYQVEGSLDRLAKGQGT
jgi:hypothetical protein